MNNDLIPFGKYKGQPIEVLQSDPAYVDWLMQQEWVRQRYPTVLSVIVNNFAEPEETPEHNKLQARFLDETIRLQLAYLLAQRWEFEMLRKVVLSQLKSWVDDEKNATVEITCVEKDIDKPCVKVSDPQFERSGIDCVFQMNVEHGLKWKATATWTEAIPRYLWPRETTVANQSPKDEIKTSVKSICDCCAGHLVAIELKPTLSDDYPAVLRQILSTTKDYRGSRVLIYEKFSSQAIDEPTLKKFFWCQNIHVFSLQEISSVQISEISRRKLVENFCERIKNDANKNLISQFLADFHTYGCEASP